MEGSWDSFRLVFIRSFPLASQLLVVEDNTALSQQRVVLDPQANSGMWVGQSTSACLSPGEPRSHSLSSSLPSLSDERLEREKHNEIC